MLCMHLGDGQQPTMGDGEEPTLFEQMLNDTDEDTSTTMAGALGTDTMAGALGELEANGGLSGVQNQKRNFLDLIQRGCRCCRRGGVLMTRWR